MVTLRRTAAAAATALAVLVPPSVAAPAPQLVDPPNDANGGAYWRVGPDFPTPVGSQPYADVTSIQFATTAKKVHGRRVVTGFTVALRLSAPPVPPADGVGIYRVLAEGPGCVFGIDYYTVAPAGHPQAAVQEWCRTDAIRRTALKPPVVSGATITWTVPLAAVPRNTKIAVGSTLTQLHFETLVLPRPAACTADTGTPGQERDSCAVLLDGTFNRVGTYTLR